MTQQEKDKVIAEIRALVGKAKQDLVELKNKLRQAKALPIDKAQPEKR